MRNSLIHRQPFSGWKDAYVWDDRHIAEIEIQSHYATLCRNYVIDTTHTVIAGHSMGGEIAIWLALRGSIESRGFLAINPVGPYLENLAEWKPFLHEYMQRDHATPGLIGFILVGDKDHSIHQDHILKLLKLLNGAGIRCEYESLPEQTHDFTPTYDTAILRALEFLYT